MSIIFLLFYLVCIFIRPQDWVPLFYGKPVIYIVFISTVFFLVLEKIGSHKKQWIHVPQNKFLVGFFLAILMSHISHTYFGGLVGAFSQFIINLMLFFLMLNTINTANKFKSVIWFIIILNVILAFQGIQQMEMGYGWAGQPLIYQKHAEVFRITWVGIFNDPNDLALTFVIAVGLLLGFIFGEKSFLQRLIALPLLALLLYGIYLTNSRGGLLALMATAYFYFVKRTNRLFWGSIIGGTVAFLFLTFGPSRTAMMSLTESSAFSRVELWYEGILMMKSNPLFGVGYNMFTDQLPQTAHNSFILAGAELGLVGLFLWVGLIYISFQGLSKVQDAVPSLRNYAYGLQASLVGFCAAAYFLSRTYVILPYLLFALSGSLMHIAREKEPSLIFTFTKKDFKITAFLTVGSLLMAYILIKVAL